MLTDGFNKLSFGCGSDKIQFIKTPHSAIILIVIKSLRFDAFFMLIQATTTNNGRHSQVKWSAAAIITILFHISIETNAESSRIKALS